MCTRPVRVLLVDDDPEDATLFSIALRGADAESIFSHAPDSHAALDLLRSGSGELPDYIFLDINMPGMDGKECLTEIKALPHLSHIPVIMQSTSNYEKDIEDTRRLGADYYMTKPMLYTDLEDMLRFILAGQHTAGSYMQQALEVF